MAAGDVNVTLVGNLTADPELRFTPSGAAVCSFTVAVQPRKFDKNTNSWVDGQASFYRCSVWRQQAENVAESLTRGTRVVVHGTIGQRSYETQDGEKRTVFEVQAEEVAASVKFAMVAVRRPERQGGQQAQPSEDPWETPTQRPAQRRPAQPQQAALDANDPWGQAPPRTPAGFNEEPPF
jgi:single-strand DNA-binding protein